MTDKKQPEALRLAALIEKTGARGSLRDQAAAELRRQYAEIETLRTGYEAARLEIESLQRRVQEVGAAARREHERAATPTAQPAPQQEAQEPHGWLYEWTHSSATGKPDATYTAFTTDEAHASKHDNCRAVYTAPQPLPVAQGCALDVVLDAFENKTRGIPQAHIAAALVAELRAAIEAASTTPTAQVDALDTMRLDWLDADESRCVFHLGKSWYTRPSYGLPYRKRASLREAIDAARAAQEGKSHDN